MKTENIFREIDSLISVAEAMQRDLSASTFARLKIGEDKRPPLRLDRIQSWLEGKSAFFFQFARTINRKAERFSESYVEFIKPATPGSYMPVGIDIEDIGLEIK